MVFSRISRLSAALLIPLTAAFLLPLIRLVLTELQTSPWQGFEIDAQTLLSTQMLLSFFMILPVALLLFLAVIYVIREQNTRLLLVVTSIGFAISAAATFLAGFSFASILFGIPLVADSSISMLASTFYLVLVIYSLIKLFRSKTPDST